MRKYASFLIKVLKTHISLLKIDLTLELDQTSTIISSNLFLLMLRIFSNKCYVEETNEFWFLRSLNILGLKRV